MLRVENLYYHPPAVPQPILQDVSLTLAEHSLGVIVGASGSGKTTFLEILAGFVRWQKGDIYWLNQPLDPDYLQQLCGLVFQFPERHFCGSTILEELRLGHQHLENDRIAQALSRVGLQSVPLQTEPHVLSGGQQRRLALAVQLLRQPSLLLLDEPTAGLDWSMRRQVVDLITELRKNWTVLIVSHEPEEWQAIASDRWQLQGGRLTRLN
ncbi:MAG: ABC transporter ATP-binding protein [Pseudanabaenaceae cyanobacterium]